MLPRTNAITQIILYWAAFRVAAVAYWGHFKRPAVVAVVVPVGRAVAISALQCGFLEIGQKPSAHRATNIGVTILHPPLPPALAAIAAGAPIAIPVILGCHLRGLRVDIGPEFSKHEPAICGGEFLGEARAWFAVAVGALRKVFLIRPGDLSESRQALNPGALFQLE